MKSQIKIANKLLSTLIFVIFGWYLIENFDSFDELLKNTPTSLLIILVVLNTIRIFNNGLFVRQTLNFFDKKISLVESFYVALITSIGNFFGPFMGGPGVRAIYLKKKHNFSYTNFTSTLFGFYFVTFIVNSAAGLLALFVIHAQTGFSSAVLYLVFAGWLITSIYFARVRSLKGLVSFVSKKNKGSSRFLAKLSESVEGWQGIKTKKNLYFNLNKLAIYGFIILYLITYVEFKAIGVEASIASTSLYVALTALSTLVSLTPSAIGIREAIFIFTSSLIGLSVEQILAIAVIDRSITFIVIFGGYVILRLRGLYPKKSV